MPLNMYQEKNVEHTSKIKQIIGIAAGKGGVGKSTVTVNLALALKKMGYSVAILDTDIYGPSIRMMLPEERMPIQKGERIIPALCKGIPMISMAYFRPDHQASVVRAPIANGIIKQFLSNVEWGDLDFLLIDFPPGTGDIQLTLSQGAKLSGVVMVTTPQNVAMLDVRKAMNMFEQVRIPIIGVVENMSYFQEENGKKSYIFGKGGGELLSSETGVPYLGSIPLDSLISESCDLGKSLFDTENHSAALSFQAFAKKFLMHINHSKQSIKGFSVKWKEI